MTFVITDLLPISLLNTDYKIFTKIITTRLNPILEKIIHKSQFAQPGKDINEMNTIIRDLVEDMERSSMDSFFVSVDFKKAYDSVNQDFLVQVFKQYGFPNEFLNLVQEIFRDAGSNILINGFKSLQSFGKYPVLFIPKYRFKIITNPWLSLFK